MKILEVTNSIESAGAGVGYVVKHLTEDLLRANHDASSMSFTQPDRAPACPAPPHWIFPQNAPRQLGHSRQLHTALLQSSADIIHQHGLWSMLSHSMNRLRARRSTPTVVSAHGMLEPAARRISPWKKRFFKIFIEQHNLRNATCLHALTPSEATHYRDLGLSQPIAIIPNAVHIVKASPPPHDLPFPIPDGRILLYLSRLHPKKGLENLLQAWAPLAPAFPDWSLLIVGPDHIGYRKHLETRIIDSNIPSVSMHEPVYGSQKHDLLELELFPDWSATHQQQPDSEVFFERETHELDACSHIICGSEWVKATTLAACDLPPEKITVIPPCIHPSPDPLARRTSRPAKTPLRVLFAGTLSLRKGIQHLHEAVRNWDGPELSVTAIGPHALPNRLLTSLSSTIKLLPALPYYKLQQVFNRYDVLVLPTLAEGSARICLEAMAAGLPVITTPNAGSLVRDQVDGFIVPAGETEPLARILNKLASDPDQTIELGEHASEQARQNTLETYCQSLINLLHSVQEESG